MTTIAVARKHGKAVIGADTLSTLGDMKMPASLLTAGNSKLVEFGDAVLAFTGCGPWEFILTEFLAEAEEPPRFDSRRSIFRWARSLDAALRENYDLEAEDEGTEPFPSSHVQLLIASPRGIFGVHADRSVDEFAKFFAFGAGGAYALGAMAAVYPRLESAEEVVRVGLECAAELQLETGPPFEIRTVRLRE
jgi:ATP-dependent protease HslVU (ClpYQ) peptidase subunit